MPSGSFSIHNGTSFVRPTISWSSTDDAANNQSTVTVVMTAFTTGTTRTFGTFTGSVTIHGENFNIGGTGREVRAGGSTVVTEMGRASKVVTHNGGGDLAVGVGGSGQFVGTTGWGTVQSGSGTATLTNYVRLPSTPGAPTLSRNPEGDTLEISSQAASSPVTLSNYQYRSRIGATWTGETNMGTDRYIAIGVDPTTSYFIQTRAVSSEGEGGWSAETWSPGVPTTPGAPSLSRSADGGTLTIFTQGVSSPVALSDYNWRSSTNGSNWGGWVSMGLDGVDTTGAAPNQPYFIQTRAVSSAGVGAPSASTFTPGVPTAPQSITIASQVGTSITITITGSSNDGGSGISAYTAQRSENGLPYDGPSARDISSGSTVFSGLTPGSTYRFRAFATNVTGNSLFIETASTLVAAYGTLRKGNDFVPITTGKVYRQGAWRNITTAKVYRDGAWRNITNV